MRHAETTNPRLTPEREFAVPGHVVFRSRDRIPDLGPAGAPQAQSQTRAWSRPRAEAWSRWRPLSVESVMPVTKRARGRSVALATQVLF